jgi:hypothetical protein
MAEKSKKQKIIGTTWLLSFCVGILAAIPAMAQRPLNVDVGAYAGAPLNGTLQQNFCCTTAIAFFHYETNDASYLVGLSAGFVLRDRFHFAFGATYMPVSFRSIGTTCCPISNPITNTHGTSWEFPFLGDYRWLSGAVRPFTGGGLVIRNPISGGDDQAPAPIVTGGVEFLRHSVVIRPELRYIHYFDHTGPAASVGRPSTQMQLMIGVLYRK